MNEFSEHVDPLDAAIIDLLCSVPEKWTEYDDNQYTEIEELAIRLLEQAGLLMMRISVQVQNDKLAESADLVFTVTGEFQLKEFHDTILKHLPTWIDENNHLREAVHFNFQPQQIRLTEQGVLARQNYLNQTPDEPSCVCSFVRKTEFFRNRPRADHRLQIESCQLFSTSGITGCENSLPKTGPVAVATASVSVGDTSINNLIVIDQELLDRLNADRQRSSADANATDFAQPDQVPSAKNDSCEIDDIGGPIPDEFHEGDAIGDGKHIKLGRDTHLSQLFWLLAKPLGKKRHVDEILIALDGYLTEMSCADEQEVERWMNQLRVVISKLRRRLREAGLDQRVAIHREGSGLNLTYAMINTARLRS